MLALLGGRFKRRIPTTIALLMISVAIFFDLLQIGFAVIVSAVAAAASMLVGWIPFIGPGLGVLALTLGFAIAFVFGCFVSILGYGTIWLWFQMRGVGTFSGKKVGVKITIGLLSIILEFVPFLSVVFGITFWTTMTIYISWKEDKEEHDKLLAKQKAEMELRQRIQEEEMLIVAIEERERGAQLN